MLNRKCVASVLVAVIILQAIDGNPVNLRNRGGFMWKRPDSVRFPYIWGEFEAKKRNDGNESVALKYSIQDLPEDKYEEAVKLMAHYYVRNEPIYSAFGNDCFGITSESQFLTEIPTFDRCGSQRKGVKICKTRLERRTQTKDVYRMH